MSGDVIETMAKALYAHENTADHWKWDDETEGLRDDYRHLAAVALSVVRDELNGSNVRATCARDDHCERCQGADGTFANVMVLFGGAS